MLHRHELSFRSLQLAVLISLLVPLTLFGADFSDAKADREALPGVPEGFKVSMFAREPLVRQPCSMAFDSAGRLFVGMGPQYRNPKPDTPGDSVVMVLDTNGDGIADKTKVFATGFNAIQGMAWHGRDLWIANSPDLTIVRDLNQDDEADEYVLLYTDLGNLEHGLHGLVWAPDGKLYMSKGNSKGLTEPGRVAPKPFRDLWGVTAPPGTPDFPEPKTFTKETYRHAYHNPDDDWGLDGGVLRCDDNGKNLEIVSRGFRNPWDITHDSGFNWLGTDNDQTKGDRVFMPFYGAHFGWNHPWSSEWTAEEHLPSAPVSGPLFEGSGTGIVFGTSEQFPEQYRNVFFINDWLRKTTFVWRPEWDGALMRPEKEWEPFITGGSALFRPTDMEFGPDGALWILGWGSGYGSEYKDGEMTSEGRVFRVVWKDAVPAEDHAPREKPLTEWSVAQLLNEFDSPLPVRRIDAQDELVRRGPSIQSDLMQYLKDSQLSKQQETWTVWTLGRMTPENSEITSFFENLLSAKSVASENLRLQSIRILSQRARSSGDSSRLSNAVILQLSHENPRFRAAAVAALAENKQSQYRPELLDLLAKEQDPVTFYSGWQALRTLNSPEDLQPLLSDPRAGVRRGVLLALLETHALQPADIAALSKDADPGVQKIAAMWTDAAGQGIAAPNIRGGAISPIETLSSVPLATGLKVRSEKKYQVIPHGLQAGAKNFSDRKFVLKKVPEDLCGADYIQTSNDDDGCQGDNFLSFDAPLPVRVSIAVDQRMKKIPDWIRERFVDRNLQIQADGWNYQIYSREFPPGRIELGGNTDDGKAGGKSQYLVILEPLPLTQQPAPADLEESLALLPQADPARGEALFRHAQGAGCIKCHSLDATRNGFGPNLGEVGKRAAARHLAESIIHPSTVITEGFNLQQVQTEDGKTYSGVLLKESGLSLTLGLASGETVRISKKKIEDRQSAKISAMPSLAPVLQSQQVADLVAFLLTQKKDIKPASNVVKSSKKTTEMSAEKSDSAKTPASSASNATELGFVTQSDRVVILQGDEPIADFVFDDPEILRPYFANLRLNDGPKVTRNYPPVPKVDPKDHADMHPGVWLGFGDINGNDFWRNQGKIKHVRFIDSPEVTAAGLKFATEDRLLSHDDQSICRMENRFLITQRSAGWRLVWEAEFFADERDITFGDQEEMGFGVRMATPIIEKNGGEIRNSGGVSSAKSTWGQPADWCDTSGKIEGRSCGITSMAAPSNFHPSWWHTRDYGLMVANPFGRKAMKQGEESRITVKQGESLRLCFAVVLHVEDDYDPVKEFKEFAAGVGKWFKVEG